jgi:hypothetical protein
VGALFLMAGAAGFVAVFLYLQVTFGYPEVLAHGAADVLPRLAAGGSRLQAAWLIYSALPFSLLLAGIASMRLLEDGAGRGLARLGAAAACLAAIAMTMGLLRWATVHAVLAERWATATPEQREIYSALFDALNRYLGNFVGELLGELALAGWFACVGVALWRVERRRSTVAGHCGDRRDRRAPSTHSGGGARRRAGKHHAAARPVRRRRSHADQPPGADAGGTALGGSALFLKLTWREPGPALEGLEERRRLRDPDQVTSSRSRVS